MHFRASKLARSRDRAGRAVRAARVARVGRRRVSTIRVRLHPYAAAAGALPPDALAKLEALVGTGLTLIGTTRTGALDLALAVPQDSAAIAAALKALRNDRSVLWAETPRAASASAKAAKALPAGANQPGQRLLVRLKDGATPDWSMLLPRLGSRHRDRPHGRAEDRQRLGAERRARANARAAGADGRRRCSRTARCSTPTRSSAPSRWRRRTIRFYSQQWSLNDPLSGVNAEAAWALQPNSSSVVVAVVDTGILPHPGPRRPRAARLRLHLRPGARARRRRARPQSARRGRLDAARRMRCRADQFLPRAVRRGPDCREHQQRHRHCRHHHRREDPAGARARRVRRHVRGYLRGHAVGVRRRRSPACRPTPIRPRSST